MGFGHRIYRVRDPRADALKAAVRKLDDGSNVRPGRVAFAEAVEAAALDILKQHKPNRPLDTNVEFYTALLLEALDKREHGPLTACVADLVEAGRNSCLDVVSHIRQLQQ